MEHRIRRTERKKMKRKSKPRNTRNDTEKWRIGGYEGGVAPVFFSFNIGAG